MTTAEAIKHLRWVLNYYSVTHTAQCRGGGIKNHERHLQDCDCETGQAFRHLERKARASREDTPHG